MNGGVRHPDPKGRDLLARLTVSRKFKRTTREGVSERVLREKADCEMRTNSGIRPQLLWMNVEC
jgi:hypothetical protein